jgi:hypothetical protein
LNAIKSVLSKTKAHTAAEEKQIQAAAARKFKLLSKK